MGAKCSGPLDSDIKRIQYHMSTAADGEANYITACVQKFDPPSKKKDKTDILNGKSRVNTRSVPPAVPQPDALLSLNWSLLPYVPAWMLCLQPILDAIQILNLDSPLPSPCFNSFQLLTPAVPQPDTILSLQNITSVDHSRSCLFISSNVYSVT